MDRTIERIQKLLRLARDAGATEAEASLALERAQEIMREHNLTVATVEAAGGAGGSRAREQSMGAAMYVWQRKLMTTVAEANFCVASLLSRIRRNREWGVGFELIGREANVASTRVMYQYLCEVINRLVLEAVGGDNRQRMTKFGVAFQEGAAERLRERISERHREYLREQRRTANAATRHPGAVTGGALVVVMEDFAQAERDLNEDFRRGRPPGTTQSEREAAKREQTKRMAERERLEAAGVDKEVAWWMSLGYSQEAAEKILGGSTETDAQRTKRERDEERRRAQEEQRRRPRDLRGHRAGREAAEDVGLDPQVARAERGRLA